MGQLPHFLFCPVEDFPEIVFFRVLHEFLCACVVGWGDVLHAVVEHQLRFLALHVHKTRLHLAVLVFNILQIQWADLSLRVGGNHRACDALVEQLLHAIAEN